MRFDLEALSSSLQQLPIDAIDEDPLQPRQEFDPEALRELADTIVRRGVLQAVSVRNHADRPGRYVLNFGARRLRASRLAGKTYIPAFIDDLATSYDQVIENEQRAPLTPLELALFVERRLGEGESRAEIARRLGKSEPYVTYATALIGAPDWLLALYRSGRCRGLRELHELRQLHARAPQLAALLEADDNPITRDRIATIRATLASQQRTEAPGSLGTSEAGLPSAGLPASSKAAERSLIHPSGGHDKGRGSRRKGHALLADHEGALVEVLVDCAPSRDGDVFVRIEGGTSRRAVRAAELKLLRIVPRP